MYWVMSIDAIIRIALAMIVLFAVIPALAGARRPRATLLEGFFWNLGLGIALITVVGQILTLGNLFSLVTLLIAVGLMIVLSRSTSRGESPWALVKRSFDQAFLAALNIFDGRVNVRRRVRRRLRRAIARFRTKTGSRAARLEIAGWVGLTALAAAIRFYRPLSTANLGPSDTYVHLYLLKLLDQGQQVDPAWGPYPRGMHFLLLAIHELTNVNETLLLNFFGAFVGVLMTLAIADAARRLSGRVAAGLLAGFLFATLIGGPGQYFIAGGTVGVREASAVVSPVGLVSTETSVATDFDLALRAYHRQVTTLPQELAIALLFPAAMFLLNFLRTRERWHLLGFAGCATAIAAIHPGVLLPLLLMSVLMLPLVRYAGSLARGTTRELALASVAAVLIGSAWALAFLAYPGMEGSGGKGFEYVRDTVLKYFPFLASQEGAAAGGRVVPQLTLFLILSLVFAIALAVSVLWRRDRLRVGVIWISAVFAVFLLIHFAPLLGLPQIVAIKRNSQWLLMSLTILLGVGAVEAVSFARRSSRVRLAARAGVAALLLLWILRMPQPGDPVIRAVVSGSGYSGSALAVLDIEQSFEPYTWTVVSYGQEFPMILGSGYHLPAVDFLERYDPTADVVPIPTPRLFIIVEKTAHGFQIRTWARRFSREELAQRLQTWAYVYQSTHANIGVFFEDENVRVYGIERTREEMERLARR